MLQYHQTEEVTVTSRPHRSSGVVGGEVEPLSSLRPPIPPILVIKVITVKGLYVKEGKGVPDPGSSFPGFTRVGTPR